MYLDCITIFPSEMHIVQREQGNSFLKLLMIMGSCEYIYPDAVKSCLVYTASQRGEKLPFRCRSQHRAAGFGAQELVGVASITGKRRHSHTRIFEQ